MTVHAVLKDCISPDIGDLSKYSPENPECFGFFLQLLVGPSDQNGSESFQVTVCTPNWLMERYSQDDILIGRHYLFVFEYNHDRIIKRIDKFLKSCSGDTWREVAEKVGRLGNWEFEDYHP